MLAEHPDTSAAARAIVEAAERHGGRAPEVETAIDLLLRMDNEHGRAGLATLRRSPRITDPSARRWLEQLEQNGFRPLQR